MTFSEQRQKQSTCWGTNIVAQAKRDGDDTMMTSQYALQAGKLDYPWAVHTV